MKTKLFVGLFAAAGALLATSCSNDEHYSVQSGNEAQVSFSLGLENGMATRAISDGTGAKTLVCAIYDASQNLLDEIEINNTALNTNGQYVKTDAFPANLTDEVNVTLTEGQTYTAVFWAQNASCNAYTTTDLKAVGVDYTTATNNDESRDAFYAAETFKVTGDATINVTLTRPFAQINVGITSEDWENAQLSGIEIENSQVVIKNAATQINLLTGAVSGETQVTYNLAPIPAQFTTPEDLKVIINAVENTYKWLSMSYFLVNDGSADGSTKTTIESLEFTLEPENGANIVIKDGLHNVPVQRNWRTNILGDLLTSNIQFNIVIDKGYLGDNNIQPTNVAVNGTTELETAMGSNASDQPITYNVQGLGTSNDVAVTIPSTFVASDATLNFTDIKDGANLAITGAQYNQNLVIKVPADVTITTLTVNVPNGHVILAQGAYTNVISSTSSSTLVISNGVNVNDLVVKSGNVSIENQGNVETIAADPTNTTPIIVYLEESAEMPEVEEGTTVIEAAEESTGIYTMSLTEDLTLDKPLTLNQNTIIEGNNKTLTYTGQNRAIEMASVVENETYLDVTIKNLTVNCTSDYCQRGINYNANGTLTLENVTVMGAGITYALNFPGKADDAIVTVTDSKLTGNIALNVWGENMTIHVTDSELTSVDNTDVENYKAISLCNDGTTAAEGAIITVEGGKIIANDENGNPSTAVSISSKTGKVNISASTEVVGAIVQPVAVILYEGYSEFYSSTSLSEAIETAIETNAKEVCLIADITTTEPIKIAGNITINLNGYDISGTDNTTKNYGLIDIQTGSNVNIINSASEVSKLTLTATNNRGWNSYSSIISNQRSVLTVGSNIEIEHLGGTDMSYGIDNLTNGKGTSATTTINGATVKSTYRAIRQFLNGTEATNDIYVNSGVIEGANKSIWMQGPNTNANSGKLVVSQNAKLKGDVYLSTTEGATEWPVEISISKTALVGDSQIKTGYIPTGYEIVETDGVYSVVKN